MAVSGGVLSMWGVQGEEGSGRGGCVYFVYLLGSGGRRAGLDSLKGTKVRQGWSGSYNGRGNEKMCT